jgi:hypothetical protein
VLGAKPGLNRNLPLAVLAVLTCRDTKQSPAVPDHAPAVGPTLVAASRDSSPGYASLARFDSLISHCDRSDPTCPRVPEDSQFLLSAGRAYRDSLGLHLRLRDGTFQLFADDTSEGARAVRYAYQAYVPDLGYYLVHQAFYEGTAEGLINERSGRLTTVDGLPVFSPSRMRVIAAMPYDPQVSPPSSITVYRIDSINVSREWSQPLSTWEPSAPTWLSDTLIRLQRQYTDSFSGDVSGPVTTVVLRFARGTWSLDGNASGRDTARDTATAQAPRAPERPVSLQGTFAYVDASGTQLLALGSPGDPSKVVGAVCSGGQVLPVRWDRRQHGQKGDSHRQIASNFSREEGNVFRLTRGEARPDETCYLSADSAFLAKAVRVAPLGLAACSPSQASRLAVSRQRQVVHCWRFAQTPSDAELLAVQFATIDSNALAGLVVVRGSSLLFQDFPAVYRGPDESVWRVDDQGIFSPGDFAILFVAQFSHAYVMAITWAGAEGESDELLVADSTDMFRTVIRNYRYWVPE